MPLVTKLYFQSPNSSTSEILLYSITSRHNFEMKFLLIFHFTCRY